jgi:hypothetical protein
MDLSTLSSLLQDHTAELTSLYGQLGASADTVPAKLEELHAALVGTVKQQKDAAVAELAEVRERVHGLRLTLERKRRRLGEGRTSTGGSESETLLQLRERLEKEDVTTERIVQAREKLFMDARKRLEAFVDALGAEVVHGMGSNGINSRSPSSNSEGVSTVSAEEDLSLERLNALEKSVSRCHAEVVSLGTCAHVRIGVQSQQADTARRPGHSNNGRPFSVLSCTRYSSSGASLASLQRLPQPLLVPMKADPPRRMTTSSTWPFFTRSS